MRPREPKQILAGHTLPRSFHVSIPDVGPSDPRAAAAAPVALQGAACVDARERLARKRGALVPRRLAAMNAAGRIRP
jgi:hypothetical protein